MNRSFLRPRSPSPPLPFLLKDLFENARRASVGVIQDRAPKRSEEHTSELQSLMGISYAVFCLKKQKNYQNNNTTKHKTIPNTHHHTTRHKHRHDQTTDIPHPY